MTIRDPMKVIVELFGTTTGQKMRRIDGVVLADGTKLLVEQVEPWQWEAAGMSKEAPTAAERTQMNRAERRLRAKGH